MRGKPADLRVLATNGALGGVAAIAAERQRQVLDVRWDYNSKQGYTAQHDDRHQIGELASAGAFYALTPRERAGFTYRQLDPEQSGRLRMAIWPFDDGWVGGAQFERDHANMQGYIDLDRRKRELEKAGAMIAAEWDRLDRIERQQTTQAGTNPPLKPTLEITSEPVTSVTLRVDIPKDAAEYFVTHQVRRFLLAYLTRMEDLRAGSHDLETFTAKQLGVVSGYGKGTLTVTCNTEPDQFAKMLADLSRLRPADEYHEDYGPVVWWPHHHGKIDEPPTIGTPGDSDWPYDSYSPDEYALFWSPLIEPSPIV